MELFRKAAGEPRVLGVFPGAFHPPTTAHLALARAALARVDEVLFVLPRLFPHKVYETVGFDARRRLMLAAAVGPRFSAGSSDHGLFIEIARECRGLYGPRPEMWFLCGRDAAERIVNWDYGDPTAFAAMLDEFGLLVADRNGPYEPPPAFAHRMERLATTADLTGVSSAVVRDRIRAGEAWEHLVPEEIREDVMRLYGFRPATPSGNAS